jgi:pimeloyl-ACP methyl ester carboxylesterase
MSFKLLKIKSAMRQLCLRLLAALIIISWALTSNASVNTSYRLTPELSWFQCEPNSKYLCSHLTVPLDYNNPKLGELKLPIKLHRAIKKTNEYLLFNFGGPWADNVKILPSILDKRLTQAMIQNFNIIVMNPRGVPTNSIKCKTDNQDKLREVEQSVKRIFAQGDLSDASQLYKLQREKQQLCHYNALYKYAGTDDTAKDIEQLRKLAGIEKLNIYMDSYATRLGLAYLIKYPKQVKRIVLDANLAPSNQFRSLIDVRAEGALVSFNEFFQTCIDANEQCVLNNLTSFKEKNSNQLLHQFNFLLKRANANGGLPTGSQYADRVMTAGMIKNLIYTQMQPSNWKALSEALSYSAIKHNNASQLMKIYIGNTSYSPKKNKYSIENNVIRRAVFCSDYRLPNFNTERVWLSFVNAIKKKYGAIGLNSTLWLTSTCIGWQADNKPLLPTSPDDSKGNGYRDEKVLIIANTKDPMTPIDNVLRLRNYLKKFHIKAKLVKWNALSHTALLTDSPLSTCVFDKVDMFLADKSLPNIMQCHDWHNPFHD